MDSDLDTNDIQEDNIDDTNQAPASSDVDMAIVYEEYRKKLMSELGADSMGDQDKALLEEKLENLVNTRLINLIMIFIPEDSIEELDKIVEEENSEKLLNFVSDKIPDFGDKFAVELMNIRDELLGKLISNGNKGRG